MITKQMIFIFIFLTALSLFGNSVHRMIRFISLGKPEDRLKHPFKRMKKTLAVAFGQSKLFREPVAGAMHAFIFWGFLVLLSAIIESIGEGLYAGFSLRFLGSAYDFIAFCQEFFAGLVIVGILIALYRRYILRPKRLQVDWHAQLHATAILFTILFIMISMLGQNATRAALGTVDHTRFLSAALKPYLTSYNSATNTILFETYWWAHIALVLGFLNYLPYAEHAHILTSIPNVYLASLEPKGALKPVDLEAEGVEKFGASDVEDLHGNNYWMATLARNAAAALLCALPI